ncbi:L-ascorbate metabolism protein UlaG (beta-lactamase superfamily) [Pantoea alhagi]|uniref:MBL fold metallo-hydrolase n=1 Tax=Mixta sp. BE291 TaxID=3158787 RepID=UPI00285678A3|nr:L-ascorbate metabolism protein UlaG (beta-lactamase superfamily) [Pantoea alhagi]
MKWENPWYDAAKPHHTPEGFRNPEPDLRQAGDLQRWRKERKAQGLPLAPRQGYAAFTQQWWQRADLSGTEDSVWWLGHAAIMLRLEGRYGLIDPVFSQRASPLRFYGPLRKTPAPLAINDLPSLDWVLISHNHYDHLDRPTVKAILRRFPQVQFIVPLGLEPWFRRAGARHVVQLDWWQQTQRHGIRFHAVPARHWSMRTPYNRNRSLWCGWTLTTPSLNFWFSGDSGYTDNLLDIARRLGPFNLAALPIGAYAPRWFMQGQHMDPQQSVALHQAIGAPVTIPIHWGVFELADEALDEAPQELARALEAAGQNKIRFRPWKIGERASLNNINQE